MFQNLYWETRKKLLSVSFNIKKSLNKIMFFADKERTMFNIRRSLLREVIKQTVLNLLLIFLTTKLDNLFCAIFKITPKIDQTLISDILIAMVGVAGVFLGLYCSYIATVFSSKYINVPEQISTLFKNDLINNKSISSITNYMIFSIIAIICNLFFDNLGVVTIITNLLLAIYMLVSYVFIGKRILGMSDTYFITEEVYRTVLTSFKKISNSKIYDDDANFQNHYKKIVIKNIGLLKSINLYNIESTENKTRPMFDFMIKNLKILYKYLSVKNSIPYNSFWFKSQTYKKWYYASDTEINIALNTGTLLGNIETYDYYWFEKEILSINERCLDELIKTRDFDLVRQYFTHLEILHSKAIENYELNYFIEYMSVVQEKVISAITDKEIDTDDELATTEALMMLYIQCILDIGKSIQNIDINQILNYVVEKKDLKRNRYIRFLNKPDVEKIYKGIIAEHKIEKQRITPDWYIKQYISKHIYDEIVLYCKSINAINCYFIDLSERLFKAKKFSAATFMYSKYVELYHKMDMIMPSLKNILEELKKYHKETKNYIWESFDFENLKNNLDNTYNDIPTKWSQCATIFTLDNWDKYDDYPDMLGACYNNICDYLIQSIKENNYTSFETVYPCLLGLVLLYQELSKKELLNIKEPFKQNMVLAVLSNPILEFGYISGYAYLWSEISGDNRWKEMVETSFQKTIEGYKGESTEFCKRVSAMLSVPTMLRPAIYNRSIIHTNWKKTIEDVFKSSGYIQWEWQNFHRVIKTDNTLLKELIGAHSEFNLLSSEAYEVFGVMILNNYLPNESKYKSRWGWENDL